MSRNKSHSAMRLIQIILSQHKDSAISMNEMVVEIAPQFHFKVEFNAPYNGLGKYWFNILKKKAYSRIKNYIDNHQPKIATFKKGKEIFYYGIEAERKFQKENNKL